MPHTTPKLPPLPTALINPRPFPAACHPALSTAVEDMQTLDGLWKAASGGKFGYSVQREMWLQARKQWPKFFKAIDWVQGENNVYR